MSEVKKILEDIIEDFSIEKFIKFFREKNNYFVKLEENYSQYNDDNFKDGIKLGEIKFPDSDELIVCAFKVEKGLSERFGKKAQYEKAKKILKSNENQKYLAGIFIFYDNKNFRFSLIYPQSFGVRRQWNNFKRFTYFVSSEFTNKTFLKQIGENEFSNLDKIKSAFSIIAVTNIFYDEFFKIYDKIVETTKKLNKIEDTEKVRDFILLFTIRTIFLGFIQKKKWIGDDEKFIQNFFKEYRDKYFGENKFYTRWLCPLFFEALNSPIGARVAYGNNNFSKETEIKLQMAPYLNGGLFKQKKGYDDNSWIIPDKEIYEFFDFLFSHSFTIEENSLEDEDLQLNPEFLGIIFERLVNKADGAVYTPRTEVDLMCRLSLVKWLYKNLENKIKIENLYELFFKEGNKEEDQKEGSFSKKEAEEILEKLENISICDPAVGSGAFLVGMIQVLDDVEQILKNKYGLNGKNIFERKQEIIKNCLYGVEVKEWAVWICHLRLWLSLFVDTPDDLKNSLEPILPSLDFKVRQGDSLVQRVGSKAFPISGHNQALSKSIKDKITKLKNLKLKYFDNKSNLQDWELKHTELAIYNNILEEEMKEKEQKLKNLKNIKPSTQQSFLNNEKKLEQLELEVNKEKIEQLEKELVELKEQKSSLTISNKPLIWNIEFVEIFLEKGGFDIIIGNPPYVRQEDIADPVGKVKGKKEYKSYLQEMVKLDFPDYFSPKAKINAQSDLYTYFYIRGLRLLNSKGIHTFICSNSWLDVGYGAWLQEFLLNHCSVELIIDNQSKRSFKAADVNTIISVVHAPQKQVDSNHLVKFVAFKQPFESSIFTENLITIERVGKVLSNDIFRVYQIKNDELKESGTEYDDDQKLVRHGKYIGDKWGGKYLRAPDIFFKILEKGKDKLVKLGDIAEVRSGFKTGVNEFFYLTADRAKEWKIEEEFLKSVIKSPRECKSIVINPRDLKYKIFMCNKSKEELKGTNALKYIEWGEDLKIVVKQGVDKGKVIKGVQNISTSLGRKVWYALNDNFGAHIFIQMTFNDAFPFYCSREIILADARLYEIKNKEDNWEDLCLSLNSTLSVLFIELYGRSNLGEGALDFKVYEAKNILLIKISNAKDEILNRKIGSIFEECGIDPKSKIPIEKQEPKPLPDRAELDKIIFDALELSEQERKDVYRVVCRLVLNRISKAKSV